MAKRQEQRTYESSILVLSDEERKERLDDTGWFASLFARKTLAKPVQQARPNDVRPPASVKRSV